MRDAPIACSVCAAISSAWAVVMPTCNWLAIAATARKGGKVAVSAKPTRDGIDVVVIDNGIGFTEQDGQKLFEKFHRIETDEPLSSTSTGLGLFIVRRIMHFEHGKVSAASPGPGLGAAFTVTWPQAASNDGADA